MASERFVLVQGLRDTRGTLARWNAAPWPVVRGWLIGASVISALLLFAVILVAAAATPDATPTLHELPAATFVTVAIAVPILVAAAFVEVYLSPHLILALRG